MPRAKGPTCAYCHGHGLYAAYWDRGMRRVMEKGAHGRPAWPNERRYACDRCWNPSDLEKAPQRPKNDR